MSSLDTISQQHKAFNYYFWLAAFIFTLCGVAAVYFGVAWYQEILISEESKSKQASSLKRAFRYNNFSCSAERYEADLLLRKVTNEFTPIDSVYVPQNLVPVPLQYAHPKVGTPQIRADVLPQLTAMLEEARQSGIDLRVNSAYRSHYRQSQLYNSLASETLITKPEKAARPGFSEHQLGSAVDISQYPNNARRGYDWLAANARNYGFILSYPEGAEQVTGFRYEPWHWRYVGVELAQYIHNKQVLFNEQKAVTLPMPQTEGDTNMTEIPYEYIGGDLWVWKSLEDGAQLQPVIQGYQENEIMQDIEPLITELEDGRAGANDRNLTLPVRDWILERDTAAYADSNNMIWLRTSFASVREGEPTERVEVLYRDDLGYLVINHQEQTLADRIVKAATSMCGFGK